MTEENTTTIEERPALVAWRTWTLAHPDAAFLAAWDRGRLARARAFLGRDRSDPLFFRSQLRKPRASF